jgi:ASCH domain
MKILSIRQPWAYLITQGSKNIENRSWPTKYRGPVLIHASLNINRKACARHGLNPKTLQRGGVVGTADIVDCVTKHRNRWFEGPYGFVLESRRPLPFVKWKGGLGLTTPPKRLLNRISM